MADIERFKRHPHITVFPSFGLYAFNLLFMHYTCFASDIIEDEMDMTAYADNS